MRKFALCGRSYVHRRAYISLVEFAKAVGCVCPKPIFGVEKSNTGFCWSRFWDAQLEVVGYTVSPLISEIAFT